MLTVADRVFQGCKPFGARMRTGLGTESREGFTLVRVDVFVSVKASKSFKVQQDTASSGKRLNPKLLGTTKINRLQ